jgi:DNA repair protein RadC
MKIKDLAEEDRPREKVMMKGFAALSDAELLAILIGSGNNEETAVQLSQRILNTYSNNLNTLGKITIKDLSRSFKGIGEVKAITILAALELGRRRKAAEPQSYPVIRCSSDVNDIFYPILADLPHEELWIGLTNNAGKVIEKHRISQGGVSETSADIRIIMKIAIQGLASGIIMCHNHPSGNLRTSTHDDKLTVKVKDAARMFDMRLLDHVVITDSGYYSYSDDGRL